MYKYVLMYPFFVSITIIVLGLLMIIIKKHYMKKLIGLAVFQSGSVFLYMSSSKVFGGSAAIITDNITKYSNPFPHVLMLTAIVVGIATVAVGCALLVRIHHSFDTLEADELNLLNTEPTLSSEILRVFFEYKSKSRGGR